MPTGTGKTVSLLSLIVAYISKSKKKLNVRASDFRSILKVDLLHEDSSGDGKDPKRDKIGILIKIRGGMWKE